LKYNQFIWEGGLQSTLLTNPTSITNFDTHVGVVPANFIINGAGGRFSMSGTIVRGTATTVTVAFRLGNTTLVTFAFASAGAGTTTFVVTGSFNGTAAAGASATIKSMGIGVTVTAVCMDNSNANFATNGTLNAQFGALFGTSNGSNTIIVDHSWIEIMSSTGF
jgi:hypothetical protein